MTYGLKKDWLLSYQGIIYIMTKEFKEIVQYETELFNYYKSKYDENNLESFKYEIYKSNDNAYVMFHYWKSF